MIPEVRWRLRQAWGFCELHAWGALACQASFQNGFVHGPAIVYEDLMGRGVNACRPYRIGARLRWKRSLANQAPCLLCEHEPTTATVVPVSAEFLRRGRNPAPIGRFLVETVPYWRSLICGRCQGTNHAVRCRPHLVEELTRGMAVDFAVQREAVMEIAGRVQRFARGFRWEYRNTATDVDRAGLVAAIGWCSGWQKVLPCLQTLTN